MSPTRELSVYLEQRGISIAAIHQKTGISSQILYKSLGRKGSRELRANEFLQVCVFVGVDPMQFAPQNLVK